MRNMLGNISSVWSLPSFLGKFFFELIRRVLVAGTVSAVFCLSSFTAMGVEKHAGLVVDHAWFCPDKAVPRKYDWWEGFGEFFPKHSVPAGSFHVYLNNTAEEPVRVTRILLDGTPLETLHDDLHVGWWRTMPNPVPPGAIAEVTIRLKYPIEGESHLLVFETDRGPVACEVAMVPPPMEIGYVSFSPELDRVFVYVQKYTANDLTLSRVHVNGRDVTFKTRFHQRSFFRNLALVEIRLPKPLHEGDRPVIKVTSRQGAVAEVMVRAWASDFFTLAAFGLHDGIDRYPDFHLNTSLTFAGDIHPHYLEQLVEYGYKALPGADSDANYYYETKDIPSVNAYFFFDEPDGKDHPSNLPTTDSVAKFRKLGDGVRAYEEGVHGLGSMALLMEEYARRIRHIAPQKGTFLIINQTYKPDNYFMYGKIPDIPAPDIYPHTTGEDPYMIYQGLSAGRLASMPRPFYSVPDFVQQAFSRYYWERTVTPEEFDLRVLYSVAAGAKGLIWYCFDGSLGWTPEVEKRMKWMNGRLEIAGPILEIGHPVPEAWATADQDKLMLRTLLCGSDTIVLTVINTNYQATGDGFSYESIPDARVRVDLPRGMRIRHCFTMDPDETTQVPFREDNGAILIDMGKVDIGNFLICTGDSGLAEALRGRWDELVAHRLAVRDLRKERFNQKLAAVRNPSYRVEASSLAGANRVSAKSLWNPLEEEENAIQWTAEKHSPRYPKEGERKGAAWTFSVDNAGVSYLIGLHLRGRVERSGANSFDIDLKNSSGERVKTDTIGIGQVHGSGTFGDYSPIVYPFEWNVKFPEPGEYTLELWQGSQRHKWFPSTPQVARHIYIKPVPGE